MSSPRAELLQDLDMAMRRASSQTVLFSQAVASRLGLHPTDLGTLDILTREGRLTAGRLASGANRRYTPRRSADSRSRSINGIAPHTR